MTRAVLLITVLVTLAACGHRGQLMPPETAKDAPQAADSKGSH